MMATHPPQQQPLFNGDNGSPNYLARPASLFQPQKIVLCKGSVSTPYRRQLVERICAVYRQAEVVEQLTIPHNKVRIEAHGSLDLYNRGHRILVFGEHNSAVARSDEQGNTCPNFWHFSPYVFCPYGCAYCYLAGTQGIRFSPTVKIFVNLEEMLAQIDRVARQIGRPEAFYLGKLQDGMALDPLTGYSRIMIPFFANHPFARLRILSKCADFDNVLDLDHQGHTILCWTLNPSLVQQEYESTAPLVEDRIRSMRRCADAGYAVRVMLMPILPIPDWPRHYDELLEQVLSQVALDRITLGGICSYGPALRVMEARLGRGNLISRSLTLVDNPPDDGRTRYPLAVRAAIYRHLLDTTQRLQPGLPCALCMEDVVLARDLGLASNRDSCNCIL
jgi:spore photoproduct lyase